MSKDSIFIWFFRYYKKNKSRYAELNDSLKESHLTFIRLRNPKEAKAFLEGVNKCRQRDFCKPITPFAVL